MLQQPLLHLTISLCLTFPYLSHLPIPSSPSHTFLTFLNFHHYTSLPLHLPSPFPTFLTPNHFIALPSHLPSPSPTFLTYHHFTFLPFHLHHLTLYTHLLQLHLTLPSSPSTTSPSLAHLPQPPPNLPTKCMDGHCGKTMALFFKPIEMIAYSLNTEIPRGSGEGST